MEMIRCVVERITYRNEETGYTVLKTRVKGYLDLVTIFGNLVDANVGSVLQVQGQWKNDPKFGKQFSAVRWEETLPATVYGMEKYLGSGLIKGVGPKFAKRIVNFFGQETLTVIDECPDRLLEIEGLGTKRVECIKQGWVQQKEIKNIMLFLQAHHVTTAHAAKIYKTYGNESIRIVTENPYQLVDDIWGIGFKTADIIAMNIGFEKNGFMRCRSGILFTLNHIANDGHCFATKVQLRETAMELLTIDEEIIVMTLDHMKLERDVIIEIEDVYLPAFYFSEVGITKKLDDLLKTPLNRTRQQITNALVKVKNQSQMQYDEIQLKAIYQAAQSKMMILTGGPGTGKTTTTTGIISVLETLGYQILLAAPTGRAAKRMSEATGRVAKTIHRLLEFKPPNGYQKNEESPLAGDVLILDECSMIDVILMYNLLKAIPSDMILIMIGDTDQLPSVGAGNILKDFIESEKIPVIKLERIFRQAMDSKIITNAHRINRGEFPDISHQRNADFFFVEEEDSQRAVAMIVKYCRKNLPEYYQVNPIKDIQVLTPMQKGFAGATNLNEQLQEVLNKQTVCLRRGGTQYRLGDKVMQIRNNYDKEVFNGDIGMIHQVDLEEQELTVLFDDREVRYDVLELEELVLAYATTIHKAQGSEYPIVIMPLLMDHYVMLQRNLIYTGITRAKKILVIVGSQKAMQYAVNHMIVDDRRTKLADRIKENI